MDNFLSESRSAGQTDSTGQFTVTGNKALEKLSAFAVQKPEQWILKMVQAAVAGGATRLSFAQTRRDITVSFAIDSPPTPMEAWLAIQSPEQPASDFLQELSIGLRALLLKRTFRIRGKARSDGPATLIWNGFSVEPSDQIARATSFEVVVDYQGSWLTGAGQDRAEEFLTVRQHAAYCPVPLFWDSREITVADLPPVSDFPKNSLVQLISGYFSQPQSEPILVTSTRRVNPLKSQLPLMSWKRPPQGGSGSFSLFTSHCPTRGYLNDRFAVVWTRRGVACEVRTFQAPLGGFLQLPGDHFRSDLAGLSLFVDEVELRLAKRQLTSLGPLAEHAIEHYRSFKPRVTYSDLLGYTGKAVGGIALLAACLLGGELLVGVLNVSASGLNIPGSSKRPPDPPQPQSADAAAALLARLMAHAGPGS